MKTLKIWHRRNECEVRSRLREFAARNCFAPLACTALFGWLACPLPSVNAQDLYVDGSSGNSPYRIASDQTYGYVEIGTTGTGVVNQTSGTLTVNSVFYVGYGMGSVGTYNLSSGSISIANGHDAIVGNSGNGTFNQTGGSVTTNGGILTLDISGGNGTFNLSGGTLTTGFTQVGDTNGTAVFTQTGGTHTTGALALTGDNPNSYGTYNLQGGVLITGSIAAGDNGDKYAAGTSTFNFNGGTLQLSRSNFTFAGLTTANVQSGGAYINTGSYTSTIGQALLHDTAAGAPATDGGLTLGGTTGTLTVSATNTYTGPTTINGGTLSVSGSLSGTSAIIVNNGGTLLLGGTGSDHLNNGASLTVASGGKFSTGGLSEGSSAAGSPAGVGALTLSGGASLDFGATGSTILAASGVINGSGKISVLNWTGTARADTGSTANDRLLFVNNPNFTAAQLSQIEFYNPAGTDLGSATEISYQGFVEVVPVPEPATWLASALLVGTFGWSQRRRARQQLADWRQTR